LEEYFLWDWYNFIFPLPSRKGLLSSFGCRFDSVHRLVKIARNSACVIPNRTLRLIIVVFAKFKLVLIIVERGCVILLFNLSSDFACTMWFRFWKLWGRFEWAKFYWTIEEELIGLSWPVSTFAWTRTPFCCSYN
jgi:hypothetical protein